MLDASVGSANSSRVRLIGPTVRSCDFGSAIGHPETFEPRRQDRLDRFELAFEAAPGFQFAGTAFGAYVQPNPTSHGTHGYDPERPEMKASLLMIGPGIASGAIAHAHLVDIAPTIAGWLGLSLPDVDGKPLVVGR